MAERRLAAALSPLGDVIVSSAGTGARDGDRMPTEAVALGLRWGLGAHGTSAPNEFATHRARRLTRDLVESADLILALGREHRSHAISIFPRASRYAFTLREFARVASGVGGEPMARNGSPSTSSERLRAAVSQVASRRGLTERPASPLDDDVVDPYQRDESVYDNAGAQLFPAADAVSAYLLAAAHV